MADTGIVRKVDELGRIVIPMELRRTFSIPEGTPIAIGVDGNTICLRKYSPVPSLENAYLILSKAAGEYPSDSFAVKELSDITARLRRIIDAEK